MAICENKRMDRVNRSTRPAQLFFLAALLILTSFGCTSKVEEPEPVQEKYTKNLLIGLIPEQNVFTQMERYEPLARYVSQKTGIGIKLEILSRYGNIINNFNSLKLDGAFFGSFTYALAHKRIAVETAIRPESSEGVSSYYGMIFVRKDSGISSIEQMKGKRFAFVDKATTAGYLLPLKYFNDNGVKDYKEYFSEAYFTGTHEDAIHDVLNKQADIGAAKNTVYYRLASSNPRILEELNILTRSPDVPSNALAFRSNIDKTLSSSLVKTLLDMNQDPEGRKVLQNFGAARFIETTNKDYQPVFDFADSAGLDLTTYDWMND